MMRLILALSLLIAGGFGASANVMIMTNGNNGVQPALCGFTGAGDNGCSTAIQLEPGATGEEHVSGLNPGDWVNQMTATTTNFASTGPARNLAGINYPVGQYTNVATLLDPAVIVPPQCNYSGGGTPNTRLGSASGGPILTCDATSGVTTSFAGFSGYRFDATGGHACVAVNIVSSAAFNANFFNNYFFNNDGSCGATQFHGTMWNFVDDNATYRFAYSTMDGNELTPRIAEL